jgi:hypothetical protein
MSEEKGPKKDGRSVLMFSYHEHDWEVEDEDQA